MALTALHPLFPIFLRLAKIIVAAGISGAYCFTLRFVRGLTYDFSHD